jgi:hypothetical protein
VHLATDDRCCQSASATTTAAAASVRADFNNDGFADLAILVQGEDVAGQADAGAVNVLYGSMGKLAGAGSQLFTQNSPGVRDTAETVDGFGTALAATGP